VFGLDICGAVAVSLLRVVRLGELASHSLENLENYEASALRLARDRAHLSLIKAKLARRRTTYRLLDVVARFTRHIQTGDDAAN
jgi:predicted O-linked N-acetylglucosamine transferase (SPINDLY family)